MKIFQIFNGFCHYDMTPQFPTIESTKNKFAPDITIVEAPDYVFQDWGYDETQEGDARFIKPTPPEGWLYDDATGTFYPEGEIAPSEIPTTEERIDTIEAIVADTDAMIVDYEFRLTMLELGI